MTPSSVQTPERLLRRLEWRVIRRLDGQLQGDYRTMFRGAGIDVADLREYELGDDVRHIDWNVTARIDVAHVRTFLEDRELTAWLLLDRSPSMGFGPTERPKETVLHRAGDDAGPGAHPRRQPGRRHPVQQRRRAHRSRRATARPGAATRPRAAAASRRHRAARTDLERPDRGRRRAVARRRSLVFVISDFISEPGWERSMARLTERHEVVAIRLVDPGELELPDAGWIVVEDVETGELLSVDTSDPEFRRRFAEVAAARGGERPRAAPSSAGIALYDVSTEDDLVRALVRMVQSRRRQRR